MQPITDYSAYLYFTDANKGAQYAIDIVSKAVGMNYAVCTPYEKLVLEHNALVAAANDNKDTEAKYRLYLLYWNTLRYTPQFKDIDPELRAYTRVSEAANEGHILAMEALSEIYKNGIPGTIVTPYEFLENTYRTRSQESKERCEKAAKTLGKNCLIQARLGDVECQEKISAILYKPYKDVCNYEKDLMNYYAYLPEAQNGDPKVQYLVGTFLDTLHREKESFEWICKAAEGGEIDAMLGLSFRYRYGIPGVVEPDLAKANEYAEKARIAKERPVEQVNTSTKKRSILGNLFGKK
ncbi:MAG: sel1 repeat family protein [Erysipelotrichales bacterium]|nr:sel1 repeat family protein [Erysipelotrichales bacterium]